MRLGLALLLCSGVATAQPVIGSPSPELPLAIKGRVTIVDFFATWCGPCHEALATLDALARTNPQIRLIVVDVGEDAQKVKAFFAAQPKTEVVLDVDGSLARNWGAKKFPTTFLVDSTGVIRHINRGYGPGYPDRVKAWAESLK